MNDEFLKKMSLKDIIQYVTNFTNDQIKECITIIDELNNEHKSKKILGLILGLKKRDQLETLGKNLSYNLALETLSHIHEIKNNEQWKLSPILVGLPNTVFSEILPNLPEKQFNLLKQTGVTEPVHHHLTLLGHQIKKEIDELSNKIEEFESRLDFFDIKQTDQIFIQSKIGEIDRLFDLYQKIELQINRGLSIAWSIEQTKVIENLSHNKEILTRLKREFLGSPKTKTKLSTGLYAKLDEKLKNVFEEEQELNDDDPAIDGLANFGIWYLNDYWNLGLLFEEDNPEKMSHLINQEKNDFRLYLFHKVKENLAKLDLNIIRDLKNHGIYSKKLLQVYIFENQEKLND